jgi:hypothetical protein
MAAHVMVAFGQACEPVKGAIYRTRNNESLMVLGVRNDRVFVEFADGRHQSIDRNEWERQKPCFSVC